MKVKFHDIKLTTQPIYTNNATQIISIINKMSFRIPNLKLRNEEPSSRVEKYSDTARYTKRVKQLKSKGFMFMASKDTLPPVTPFIDPDAMSTEQLISQTVSTAIKNHQEYKIIWLNGQFSIWIRDPQDIPEPTTSIASQIIRLIEKL